MSRKTVSVSLPRALVERLEAHAYSEGVTLSDVLRGAIVAYDQTLLSHVMAALAADHTSTSTIQGGFPWQTT
jgi:Ribbon-helix-helix protein, copG family